MAERGQLDQVGTWLAAAVGGDRLALQKLLLFHHGRLRALAARRIPAALRGRFDAEDLLQEVYVEVAGRIRSFVPHGGDCFFGWLAAMLTSRLADARRFHGAAGRDVARERRGADTPSGFDRLAARGNLDSLTPSRVLSRRETEGLLLAALAGLLPDHRRVLELRFFQDLPLAAIARAMDRSLPAAQMLCARALRALRESARRLSRG